MRDQRAPNSAYFITEGTSLKLIRSPNHPALENFIPNQFQATHDLVGSFYEVNPDKIAHGTNYGYNTANNGEGQSRYPVLPPRNGRNIHDIKTQRDITVNVGYLLEQDYRRTQAENFIAKANPLAQPKPVTIHLSQVTQLSKEMQVYFSPEIDDTNKEKIIKTKAGISHDKLNDTGYKMTFMVGSRLYLDGRNRFMCDCGYKLKDGLPVKIFNFCYPDFRHYRAQIVIDEFARNHRMLHCGTHNYDRLNNLFNQFGKQDPYQDFQTLNFQTHQDSFTAKYLPELKEIFRINLQALIAESVRQKNSKNNPDLKLPFIVLTPGSFITRYKTVDQEFIKKIVDQALREVLKENIILVKRHICEVIEIGFNFPPSPAPQAPDQLEQQIKIHRVNTDMVEIAKTLNQEHDIEVPLPMMAHPTEPIGNGYFNVMQSTSTDEQLAKMSGNIADLVFARGVMKNRSSIKDLNDPVFKTLTKIEFVKTTHERDDHVYFQQSPSQDVRTARSAQSQAPHSSQHSFSIKKDNFTETNDKIDTAQIFCLAVENSVKDLSFFENYKTDAFNTRLLFNIMNFAKEHQGVGNKELELRQFLVQKNYPDCDIENITTQAKKFSANFQIEMQNYGLMTGNQNPTNIVGARLHRMASKENIEQFFSNSLHKESLPLLSSPPSTSPAPTPRAGRPAGRPGVRRPPAVEP